MEIKKEDVLQATKQFIAQYDRLPYELEDSLIFHYEEDGQPKERVLRAHIQIDKHFDDMHDFISELTSHKIISRQLVADTIGLSEGTDLDLLFNGERKRLDDDTRRALELFLGYDMYEHFDKWASLCLTCSRCMNSCKEPFPYWIDVVACHRYNKSKRKG